MRTRALALLLIPLLPALVSAKQDLVPEERLPLHKKASAVATELVAAFESSDWATFDELAKRPTPPMIEVVSLLLNHPNRAVNETELAVIERIVQEAPTSSGVAGYAAHWMEASQETRLAERRRWGLSARYRMQLRNGTQEQAKAFLQPELPALRKARYSQQAYGLRLDYCGLLLTMGQFQEAEAEARSLLAKLEEERREHEQLKVYKFLAQSLEGQSPVSDAPKVLEEGQTLAKRLGMWEWVADFAHFRGSLAILAGKHEEAEEQLQLALAAASAAPLPTVTRAARLALATLARAQGQRELALEHTRRALKDALAGKDLNASSEAVCSLVSLHLDRGHLGKALANEAWLEANGTRATQPVTLGAVHSMLSLMAHWRGNDRQALEHSRQAYESVKNWSAGQRSVVSHLSGLLRNPLLSKEERDRFLPLYRASVEREAQGAWEAWIRSDAVVVELNFGDAEVARRQAKRALAASKVTKDAMARSQGHYAMASAHFAEGNWAPAREHFASALAQMQGDSPRALECYAAMGSCLVSLGRPREAVAAIRKSLIARARFRDDVTHASALETRNLEHRVAARGIWAAHALAQAEPDAAGEAARVAWWFREQGTGRLLAEAVEAGQSRPPREARQQLAEAVDDVESTQRQLIVAIARGEVARQEALRTELGERFDRLQAASQRHGRRKSDASHAQARDLDLVRASLAEDEAILAYTLDEKRIFAIAVNRDSAEVVDLGDQQEASALIRKWKTLAATPDGPDEKLAARLYDRLIRPLERRLTARAYWTVLPDGPLAGVPLDAWMRTADEGAERLIERHTLTYAHSIDVRDALHDRATARPSASGVVALGDPVYPTPKGSLPTSAPVLARLRGGLALPRLIGSREEAERVAAQYPERDRTTLVGEDATRKQLLEILSKRDKPLRALHLACHGIVDDTLPTLSGLVFSGGDVLTAERLASLEFEADLAVLSACDSGAGKRTIGEGVLGLTRALFLSGVSQVICSTWQVADSNTAGLMVHLHEAREQQGRSARDALRDARLSLLRNEATAHPFYWAGLQLWGSGAR